MKFSNSERRLAKNQVVFRSFNENVQAGFDRVNKLAAEEGYPPVQFDEDTPLYFYCECSDENCRNRLKVSPKAYNVIHLSRDTFVITCGHEITDIEKITTRKKEYCVVRKYNQPPESVDSLNITDVDNA